MRHSDFRFGSAKSRPRCFFVAGAPFPSASIGGYPNDRRATGLRRSTNGPAPMGRPTSCAPGFEINSLTDVTVVNFRHMPG